MQGGPRKLDQKELTWATADVALAALDKPGLFLAHSAKYMAVQHKTATPQHYVDTAAPTSSTMKH